MTDFNGILFRYLTKEFLKKFFVFFLIIMGVVFLFDLIEILRRIDTGDKITFIEAVILGLYKLPGTGQEVIPFITLFSGIALFKSMGDRQELVSIQAAGVSVWQIITPILTTIIAFSLLFITILNPLTAASLSRYANLESKYFGDGTKTVSVVDDGLWIHQEDDTGYFILKAAKIDFDAWTMADVSIFFFDKNKNHTQRLDAEKAKLLDSKWIFSNVSVFRPTQTPKKLPQLSLVTSLTIETLSESFSNPQTISFWRLPHFIKSLAATGFETIEMQSYYQSLLSLPLFLSSMIFLAAAIGLKTERVNNMLPIIVGALGFGLIAFFLNGFLKTLAVAHEIPVFLGVWAGPAIIMLSAISILSLLKDG